MRGKGREQPYWKGGKKASFCFQHPSPSQHCLARRGVSPARKSFPCQERGIRVSNQLPQGFWATHKVPTSISPLLKTSKAEAEMARNQEEQPGLPRSPQCQLLFKGPEFYSFFNWKQPTVLQQMGNNLCIYTSNGLLLIQKKYMIDIHNNMKDLESIALGKTYQTLLCTVIREN